MSSTQVYRFERCTRNEFSPGAPARELRVRGGPLGPPGVARVRHTRWCRRRSARSRRATRRPARLAPRASWPSAASRWATVAARGWLWAPRRARLAGKPRRRTTARARYPLHLCRSDPDRDRARQWRSAQRARRAQRRGRCRPGCRGRRHRQRRRLRHRRCLRHRRRRRRCRRHQRPLKAARAGGAPGLHRHCHCRRHRRQAAPARAHMPLATPRRIAQRRRMTTGDCGSECARCSERDDGRAQTDAFVRT